MNDLPPTRYDDEILDANWTPPPASARQGLRAEAPADAIDDPDTFLNRVYRCQE